MKNKISGFTLVELMIVIALIMIIALGMNSLDFNTLSNKQKAEIFANKIVSEIETARNNALVGKSIRKNIPKKWKIEISPTNNSIKTSYFVEGVWNLYNSIESKKNTKIHTYTCGTNPMSTGTGIIIFEGMNANLSGSCEPNIYSLYIKTNVIGQKFNINFDSVTGIITSKYEK